MQLIELRDVVRDEADLNKMLKLVTWSSVPVAVVTLIYIGLGKTAGSVDGFEAAASRYGGPFPHANILAFYLVLSVGVIFYRWKSGLAGRGVLATATVEGELLGEPNEELRSKLTGPQPRLLTPYLTMARR